MEEVKRTMHAKNIIVIITLCFIILAIVVRGRIFNIAETSQPVLGQSYGLEMQYRNGVYSVSGITLTSVEPANVIVDARLPHVDIISKTGSNLLSVAFSPPIASTFTPSPDWFDKNGNQVVFPSNDGNTTEDSRIFSITVPVYTNAGKFEIYDASGKLNDFAIISDYFVK